VRRFIKGMSNAGQFIHMALRPTCCCMRVAATSTTLKLNLCQFAGRIMMTCAADKQHPQITAAAAQQSRRDMVRPPVLLTRLESQPSVKSRPRS
jgi:hypothetical protein